MLSARNCVRNVHPVRVVGGLTKTINLTNHIRLASSVPITSTNHNHTITTFKQNELLNHKELPMVDLLEQLNGLHLKSNEDDTDKSNKDESPLKKDDTNDDSKPESDPQQPQLPNERKRRRRDTTKKIEKIAENLTAKASDKPKSDSNNNGENGGGDDDGSDSKKSQQTLIPDVYPQVLALPMSRRPLFPGFYRPVAITDPQVIKAIHELCDKSKPYIGIFLFKDENGDGDVIHDKDEVHEVGVFAQITSSFISKDENTGKETLTIIAYPHARIKIDELIPPPVPESKPEEITEEKPLPETLNTQQTESPTTSTTIPTEDNVESSTKKVEKTTPEETVNELEQHLQQRQDEITKLEKSLQEEEEEDYNPVDFLKKYSITRVNISKLEDEPFDRKAPVINALTSEILKVFKEVSQINSMFREQIATFSATIQTTANIFEQPAKLADFCAAVCAGEPQELQDVLDSSNIEQRLEKALIVLKKEIMTAELQNKISKDVENKIQKRQREYYLMEQLKGIKKELGIDDGRQKLIDKFKERAENLKLPTAVQKVFDEEISKLSTLETAMSEFSVTRNYLDWLTQLPWGKYTKETFDIKNAKKILDEDHYGLPDIKDRILEFIAVGNLLGAVDGKIICFVGPPGVGKTSIGKSIARALNRNYFRFSVGGISDVSEIKGHRRTYIGALPGRIIQGLKKTESQNPLFLIDEIDKVTHGGSQGDPSAALLELLDPEQNNEFLDQYLDIPVDLSKVLFVCTANTLDTIPRPLLDRMEIIELPGYVAEEKVKIAENYLIPLAKKSSGLEDVNINLTTEGVETIVRWYAKENGVRRLKQLIEKVFRKAAFKAVTATSLETSTDEPAVEVAKSDNNTESDDSKSEIVPNLEHNKPLETKETVIEEDAKAKRLTIPKEFELTITPENLKDFIGPQIYTSDRLYETTPPGVIMGLAWTSIGGTSMYVEAIAEESLNDSGHPSGGRLSITGQLGDVMKESGQISFAIAKQYIKSNFFKSHNINIHCPEGAVPKDGPSAGITLTTALISLALNHPLPSIAMTGEITLTGKVLRIGGLKEKLIAAKRNGVTTLFLPKDNKGDYEDLPENLREGFEVTFVENYSEIFDKLFKGLPNEPTVLEAKVSE